MCGSSSPSMTRWSTITNGEHQLLYQWNNKQQLTWNSILLEVSWLELPMVLDKTLMFKPFTLIQGLHTSLFNHTYSLLSSFHFSFQYIISPSTCTNLNLKRSLISTWDLFLQEQSSLKQSLHPNPYTSAQNIAMESLIKF